MTFFDIVPSASAQCFIENRGQWDSRVLFASAAGEIVVTPSAIEVRTHGCRTAIALDSCHIVAEGMLPAVLNYYTPAGSIEGVPAFASLRIERNGHVVGTLAWRGNALTTSGEALHADVTEAAIDPLLLRGRTGLLAWGLGGRFLGGSGRDSIAAAAFTGGSIVVAGWTDSPSFPAASGSPSGGRDALVAKLAADGTLAWATLIGGSYDDAAFAIAFGGDAVVIAGTTRSSNFPTTSGTVQPSYGSGDADGFVATFDPTSGTRRAATFIGGDGSDALYAVAATSNRIVVAGGTTSSTLAATVHQQQFGGVQDGYIIALSPQLTSRQWSTYYGGRGLDEARGVGILGDGSIVVAGVTTSPNTGQAIAAGIGEGSDRMAPPDGFLARFDANGQRLWGRYYGSDGQDSITSLSVTPSGAILITGMTNGTNTARSYIAEAQAAQNNFAGGEWDGFVAVLRPDGTRLWGSYYGGSGSDRSTGAAMDSRGYVLVTGWTNSSDFPTAHSDNTAIVGGEDAFVGFFSPDGTRRYASLLYGGSGADLPVAIGYMPDSSIAVVGTTTSTSFSPLDGSSSGAMDGFVLRVGSLGILSVPSSGETRFDATSGDVVGIELPLSCGAAQVRIYTLGGGTVASERFVGTVAPLQLQPGVYAVVVQCSSGEMLRRLLLVQ
ncbi:MAG: hypothetical protein N3B17_03265 [Chlorobi bacterium]|nr:hypothetical protein [Chlorobiota bacterium]